MSESPAVVLKWPVVADAASSQRQMSPKDCCDEELMLRCRSGDDVALTELFRRYKDRIYHFAYRMLQNETRAEDVLQETFLRIHNCAASWQPSAKFSSWAFRIARNLCVDEKRKYWNRQVIPESQVPCDEDGTRGLLSVFASSTRNPRSQADDAAAVERVRDAIAKLSPEQQEVMVLSKYHGMSYPEIAEVLGISQESVKQRAYRAHLRLRQLLRALLEDQDIR